MKHTITTHAGVIAIEPTAHYNGAVQISLKPVIWPAVLLTIKPEEARLVGQALLIAAGELTAKAETA